MRVIGKEGAFGTGGGGEGGKASGMDGCRKIMRWGPMCEVYRCGGFRYEVGHLSEGEREGRGRGGLMGSGHN